MARKPRTKKKGEDGDAVRPSTATSPGFNGWHCTRAQMCWSWEPREAFGGELNGVDQSRTHFVLAVPFKVYSVC